MKHLPAVTKALAFIATFLASIFAPWPWGPLFTAAIFTYWMIGHLRIRQYFPAVGNLLLAVAMICVSLEQVAAGLITIALGLAVILLWHGFEFGYNKARQELVIVVRERRDDMGAVKRARNLAKGCTRSE